MEEKENIEVLINTVYTGDYTNENIGHEIINMYKTDENENYIYISPWGTLAKENYNKIKEVIFVRDAGKNKLEIIGKASGLNYWGNEEIDDVKTISNIKTSIEQILRDKDIKYRKKFEKLKDKYEKVTYKDMEDFIDFAFDKKIKEKIKKDINEIAEEKLQKTLKFRISKDAFQKLKDCDKNDEKNTELDLRHEYEKRIEKEYKCPKSKYIHNLQIVYIKQKNIKYNEKFINEVFKGNFHSVPPIYLTFKANCVKKAKKSFIIDYGNKKIKEILKNSKEETSDELECKNEEIKEKDIKLRNQSCLYYLSQKKFDEIIEESKNGYNNVNNWADTTKLQESTDKNDEETFIDIIRKPYDELVFSNMIAYYFENDKELFKNFFEYLINNNTIKEDELIINKTYEISREYKVDNGRIDILIRTDNSLFIIENKIKSDINGKQYDPYTGKYSNQLINYYNHFNPDEKNEVDENFKNIKQYYFIFTPNYNKIDKEKIKEIINPSKEENNKSCKIIDLYNIITYEDLYNFFKKNKPKQITSNKQKVYFEDFVNSLKQHSHSCDDVVERRMEKEFRQKTKK